MAFYTPSGKEFLNLPEQVQKNLDDIASLKESITSLQNSKQDATGAITESNLKEKVEAVGSFDLKDISTTGITNTGDFTNAGKLDQEGDASFGTNVEVDGDATLNNPENAKFKTGSLDFSALTDFIATYYANEGIAKYANQTFVRGETKLYTADVANYTDISRFLQNSGLYKQEYIGSGPQLALADSISLPSFSKPIQYAEFCIQGVKNSTVILNNFEHASGVVDYFVFAFFDGTRIEVADGATVKLAGVLGDLFYNDKNLEYVGAIDVGSMSSYVGMFSYCMKIKEIHLTHINKDLDISSSIQFEESDLVEIISNLDTVTTAKTLTMGAKNLAKLTQDEILVATGKGWTLA